MNRVEVEVQAPWALRYYDEGVSSGKTNPAQASFSFANQWVDINDHAPVNDQHVLFFAEESICLGYCHYEEDGGVTFTTWKGVYTSNDVTYWMPAPKEPS